MRILCLVCITALLVHPAKAQWVLQVAGTNTTLWGVTFATRFQGWAVYNNFVLKTTNAGIQWSPTDIGNRYVLTSLSFVDLSHGWASGAKDTGVSAVVRSVDGGNLWTDVSPTEGFFISGICFINRKSGWGFGQRMPGGGGGLIVRTTDAGLNWETQYRDPLPSGYLLAGYFVNSLVGWAVGWKVILHTSDGGNSWVEQDTVLTHGNLDVPLSSVHFVNKQFGWVVGGISDITVIARTTDGGETWTNTVYDPPPPSLRVGRLNGVHFVNARVGWAVGRGYFNLNAFVIKTTDGGTTWFPQVDGTNPSLGVLQAVTFADSMSGWAVGQGGTILHTSNGGVTFVQEPLGIPDGSALYQNYPNPFNPSTTIQFQIAHGGHVELRVFDILGRVVATLVNEARTAGVFTETFDASHVSSGVYIYKLTAGSFSASKKLLLVK